MYTVSRPVDSSRKGQTMRLSETKQGDLIKFSEKSKVDWYIAYRNKSLIEM